MDDIEETIDGLPIRYLGDVARMKLEPGDVVVVTLDAVVDENTAEQMRHVIQERVGAHEVLILSGGIKLGVISPARTEGTH